MNLKFFSSRISKKENEDRNLWQVPIIYDEINNNNNNNKNEYKILLDRKSTIISKNSLGKINKNESSFFRVKYDKEILKFLQNEIRENKMPLIDRLGAVRDIFALAEGGYIGTTETLEFIENYKDEDEYIVWVEISAGLNKIYNLFSNKNTDIKYKKYALSLFSPLAKKIGFEKRMNEKHTDIFLRSLALTQASSYEDKKIIKELRSIWNNRMIRPIDKDIRAVVYDTVARNGKEKDWNNMLNLYKRESLEEEKDRISRAMALFKDKKLITKTLDFAMAKEVRDQDRPFIIAVLLQNKESRDIAYKFIKKNWKLILEKYGSGLSLIQKLIYPLENFNKEKNLKDLQKFFKQNVAPGADRTLLQTYEKITSNIAWFSADKKSINNWLSKNF